MLNLRQALPHVPIGKALDVGTRLGEFAIQLAAVMPKGSEIIGIDCDEDVIRKAQHDNEGKAITFLVGDGSHMNFADDAFEVVAISNTLHHIKYYGVLLAEMFRVLKPGGYFVVNEMFRDGQNAAQLTHVAQHAFEAKLDRMNGLYQRTTWRKVELMAILNELPLKETQFSEYLEDTQLDQNLLQKNLKLEERTQAFSQHANYQELIAEASKIRIMCQKNGIQRCTQLLFVGRKAE